MPHALSFGHNNQGSARAYKNGRESITRTLPLNRVHTGGRDPKTKDYICTINNGASNPVLKLNIRIICFQGCEIEKQPPLPKGNTNLQNPTILPRVWPNILGWK